MRLWFSRNNGVPLREQLVTQVVLAILCRDLAPGQRLPSTRELSRRFDIHPNTVSAAYQELEREGWVEFRRGSGVYVRARAPKRALSAELRLDGVIADLFRSARELGAPLATVRARLRHWLEMQPPDHFLVIEPEEELAKIIAAELQPALALPVRAAAVPPVTSRGGEFASLQDGAVPVVLPSKEQAVREALPPDADLFVLHVNSVNSSLAKWLPAPATALVGVASRWPRFLELARTMLTASGFHPDSLVFRDARVKGWQQGLGETQAVVCDVLTASSLPKKCRAIPFPLIAQESIARLREYEQFVTATV